MGRHLHLLSRVRTRVLLLAALSTLHLAAKPGGTKPSTPRPAKRKVVSAPVAPSTLHLTVASGDLDAVKVLLRRHAPVDSRDALGETPLMAAIRTGKPELVELLLDARASLSVRDHSGFSPLFLAILLGEKAIALALMEHGANLHERDTEGRTFLHRMRASMTNVQLLLDLGCDVNAADKGGRTALYAAIQDLVIPEIPKALLEKGADPDRADAKGVTPLMRAAERSRIMATFDPTLMGMLLSAGANPHRMDSNGRTALHWTLAGQACPARRETLAFLLTKANADADLALPDGTTPLMLAARLEDPSALRWLLAAGADPQRSDGKGRTALDFARKGRSGVCVSLLEGQN